MRQKKFKSNSLSSSLVKIEKIEKKNRENLENIVNYQTKDNPYKWVSDIYHDISKKYDDGYYEESYDDQSDSGHNIISEKNSLLSFKYLSQGIIRKKKHPSGNSKPSNIFSLYRRVHKILSESKYNKKKYDHDYNMRSYNVLNISVPESHRNDNLDCLPIIKK